MKDINELRQMTLKDLHAEVMALRKKQFELRMKKANGVLDKTHVVGLVRKAIARAKIVMTEKAGSDGNK